MFLLPLFEMFIFFLQIEAPPLILAHFFTALSQTFFVPSPIATKTAKDEDFKDLIYKIFTPPYI